MTTDEEIFTDRELRQLDEAFERRDEQREIGADLLALADRQASIERLEDMMATDIDRYFRSGGADKLLALRRQEGD